MEEQILRIDNVNGQILYKDEEGWKFYCLFSEISDEDFEKLEELTKEEYQEISE